MNSRSPRMKFVSIFLCCVTLLELIDKQTFGANTDSPQGHESRRFSLFYKVKEGMFKKLLHDSSNSFCNLHHENLLVLDKMYSHFLNSRQMYALRHTLGKEQVSCHAGGVY